MRYVLIIALMLTQMNCFACPGLQEVRDAFYSVSEEKAASDKLLEAIVAAGNEAPNVLLAYKGMYHMLQARELVNPYSKWASFRKGRILLDRAIDRDGDNAEIRLLRLSAQMNAPSFLGYNNNMEADKRVILNALSSMKDNDLKRRITSFMMGQGLIAENSKQ
ncbi:MAG: hypothetical protein KF744_11435 [Taibaiella sp.]|nr:hypothetical protein [Taibaiella sp.]